MKPSERKNRAVSRRASHRLDRSLVLLALPTLVWYLAFCYLPMFGIVIAFKRYRMVPGKGFLYSLFRGSDWVGLENFRFLFLNPQMGIAVRNTLLYNLAFLVLGTVLPVMLAIALSYLRSDRLRTLSQATAMLPHFLSWIIVSYFAFSFLSSDKGLLNSILVNIGLSPVRWYQDPSAWPWLLVLIHGWKGFGYSMVLYYSYVSAVDLNLYDSAAIDGSSAGQMIRYITLPQLKGVITVLVLLNLGHILSTDFGLFYQVTRDSGAILSATETIDVYVYKALMDQSNYGFSAAASLLQNGIGCLLLLGANRLTRQLDPEGGVL